MKNILLSFLFLRIFILHSIKAISFGSLGTKLGNLIKTSAPIKSALVSLTLNSWDGQENVELNIEEFNYLIYNSHLSIIDAV